jgi:hypothetical protein
MRQSQGQKKEKTKSLHLAKTLISMPCSTTLLCLLPSTAPCMLPILAGPYKALRATQILDSIETRGYDLGHHFNIPRSILLSLSVHYLGFSPLSQHCNTPVDGLQLSMSLRIICGLTRGYTFCFQIQ